MLGGELGGMRYWVKMDRYLAGPSLEGAWLEAVTVGSLILPTMLFSMVNGTSAIMVYV